MVTRIDVAHGRARRALAREADRQMRRAWVAADGVNEDRFVADAAAIADTMITATVSEYDAYLAAAVTASGTRVSPAGLDPADYRRPVDPDVQWRRPFTHMRMALDDGAELPRALAVARHQAATMIATDLQAAARDAANDWMIAEPRVVAYARVLGSGGASGENCGLCIVASTQRYWVGDLMPIHDHCTCEVKPLLEQQARTQVIEHNNLDEVHRRLDEIDGEYAVRNDLRRVRIEAGTLPRPAVAPHAEVGPYLYQFDKSAPTPRSVAAATRDVIPDSARQRRINAALNFRQTGPLPDQPGWDLIKTPVAAA